MVFCVKADQRVLRHLISSYLPDIDAALKQHDIGELMTTCLLTLFFTLLTMCLSILVLVLI